MADRRWIRAVLVVALAAAVVGCDDARGERFAIEPADDGTLAFLTCERWFPATATVWRSGGNSFLGDGDDDLIFGPSDEWVVDADSRVARLRTSVAWDEPELLATVAATSDPVAAIGSPPPADSVRTLDGVVKSTEEFLAQCD
jgi:hypothetical protein